MEVAVPDCVGIGSKVAVNVCEVLGQGFTVYGELGGIEDVDGAILKSINNLVDLFLRACCASGAKSGDADGQISGALSTTGDTLRPALQIIKCSPGISCVSGAMLMITDKPEYGENGVLVIGDVAVTPVPDANQLAQIAVCTAQTAKSVAGFADPRVAMLSFSTKGSAKHEVVDKVIEATRIAHEMEPELKLDGELQADAALVASVGEKKCPGSPIAGHANVLIAPSLEVGNIGYKLVQRLAGADAIGPILQGIARPVNDLSRGCSVDDIYKMVAITACQAMDAK